MPVTLALMIKVDKLNVPGLGARALHLNDLDSLGAKEERFTDPPTGNTIVVGTGEAPSEVKGLLK